MNILKICCSFSEKFRINPKHFALVQICEYKRLWGMSLETYRKARLYRRSVVRLVIGIFIENLIIKIEIICININF